jgi:hypothetical protein
VAGSECVVVNVPMNGYFVDSSYGPGWNCDRGYHSVGETCVALEVPDNAHLDFSGNAWACNRPYQKQRNLCGPPL